VQAFASAQATCWRCRWTGSFDVRTLPGFTAIAILAFLLLYAPILTLVISSFNGGNSVNQWGGFSLEWYVVAFNNAAVQDATARSIIIALWASVISTTAATMAALGTTRRGRFRGQTVISTIFNQPLMVPGVIAGAMLVFIISLDNMIITEFVKSAGQDTLPTYM
jgi:spermidine/putrescine transport system permease protein